MLKKIELGFSILFYYKEMYVYVYKHRCCYCLYAAGTVGIKFLYKNNTGKISKHFIFLFFCNELHFAVVQARYAHEERLKHLT